MQIVNNLILDTTAAADGLWRNVSNMQAISLYVTGLEGNVWVEASNDPNVNVAGSAIGAPVAPTLTSVPLQVPNPFTGTIFVKVTYVTNGNAENTTAPGESLASTEASVAVTGGNGVQVASPVADAGKFAVAYNVYASTATTKEVLQNVNAPIPLGQSYIIPYVYPSNIAPPSSDTTHGVALGINITGNLKGASNAIFVNGEMGVSLGDDSGNAISPTATTGTQTRALLNPSCLTFQWIRVRKSGGGAIETKAYLFGQNG